ncbi:MAG: hypothetical protein ACLTKQ_08375 [Acutalibacteraceae bacterium]
MPSLSREQKFSSVLFKCEARNAVYQIQGFKFVFGGDVPAPLITVGKAKQIKDGDRNG